MSGFALDVQLREKVGKGVCRRLRAAGRIPGVVYGRGVAPVHVSVDYKEFAQAIAGEGGQNRILSLKGAPSLEGQSVIVAEMVRDRMKGVPIHVDLHQINLADKVKVKVKVNLVGPAIGVKEGGFLDFAMHELDIECRANEIPEHIDVDITQLTIGHSMHVGEVAAPAGITILDDPSAPIVSILGRKSADAASAEEPAV